MLGRPENDGTTNVWYTLIDFELCGGNATPKQGDGAGEYSVEFVPVVYDHNRLASEMREEKLPEDFAETIQTGWWTTCLEVLPGKERRTGRF